MAFALLALALGGFAIGTTEFMTMGLLEEIADGIGRTNAETGHIITAYAFGVVVGAPIIVSLGARLPKKGLAIGLILALGVGNAITAVASGYLPVMLARFVAGLPHGAYFGVASLLAASLVRPELKGRAVSSVMLGLSVATVAGVPASTILGQTLGWRSAYWAVLIITIAAAAMIYLFVPHSPANAEASLRGELVALKQPQVLFAVSAGMIGFGGLFAMYSYIAPIVTKEMDLSDSWIAAFTLAYGAGSVLGSWAAGILADWNVERSVLFGFLATAIVLVVFYVSVPYVVPALLLVLLVGVLGSVVAITLQIRLMDAAGDAQMLGAALNHSALNLANGLGAFLGSVIITAGHGYRATAWVGVVLSLVGAAIFAVGLAAQRRSRSAGGAAQRV
ncbi:MFS transporter [Aeromicrobium wangtongii]|uniref:MFS transporter n=1 Tax=Aeromicrobium wangtongii TaxID=2969247 RepID=A0ABY5M7Z6_9ACTN|nr:MFS transporter [Aeromicrobium wangtongii]MCD9198897.1 MFS transporter [Aeromicrobium wangtongii]UUP13064.1 MFS transporter [Aeromicrobium wangtongii]